MVKGPKCKCGRDTFISVSGSRLRRLRYCSGCNEVPAKCTCTSVKPPKKEG